MNGPTEQHPNRSRDDRARLARLTPVSRRVTDVIADEGLGACTDSFLDISK